MPKKIPTNKFRKRKIEFFAFFLCLCRFFCVRMDKARQKQFSRYCKKVPVRGADVTKAFNIQIYRPLFNGFSLFCGIFHWKNFPHLENTLKSYKKIFGPKKWTENEKTAKKEINSRIWRKKCDLSFGLWTVNYNKTNVFLFSLFTFHLNFVLHNFPAVVRNFFAYSIFKFNVCLF